MLIYDGYWTDTVVFNAEELSYIVYIKCILVIIEHWYINLSALKTPLMVIYDMMLCYRWEFANTYKLYAFTYVYSSHA